MVVNPYTLQHLYNNGIIDYVPQGLVGNVNTMMLNSMQNPYLNLAKQGALYNGYDERDCFYRNNLATQPIIDSEIGSHNTSGVMQNYGFEKGIGIHANYGVTDFYGSSSNIGVNSNDSFSNPYASYAKENINDKESNMKNSWLKGALAGTIIVGTLALLFKGRFHKK